MARRTETKKELKAEEDYQREMAALGEQRRFALEQQAYADYSVLCDQTGIIDDNEAYERGILERNRERDLVDLEDLQEDAGGLEGVVEEGVSVPDDSLEAIKGMKFGTVKRSNVYFGLNEARPKQDWVTDSGEKYALRISDAYRDPLRDCSILVRADVLSHPKGKGAGEDLFRFSAGFKEIVEGRNREFPNNWEYTFPVSHDEKKDPEYANAQLKSLKNTLTKMLPDARIAVIGNELYLG